jgi:hypothetical protein
LPAFENAGVRTVLALLVAAAAGVCLAVQNAASTGAAHAACTHGHWEAPARPAMPAALADAGDRTPATQPHACTPVARRTGVATPPASHAAVAAARSVQPAEPPFRRFPLLI